MNEFRSRLYLMLSTASPVCRSRDALLSIIEAGDVACLMLRRDADATVEDVRAIAALAQTRDVAVLVEDDPDLANEIRADGVHVNAGLEAYDNVRRTLPDDSIVGVDAAGSRHKAMEAGERGADYVVFPADDDELVTWWTTIFQVPCVALADGPGDATMAAIGRGAEFIALDGTGWADADEAVAAVSTLSRQIDQSASELVQ
jgi:thiamine-phosphate pyrophosphorylase